MSAIKRLDLSLQEIEKANSEYSHNQTQTQDIFGFKWSKRDTYESDAVKKAGAAWLIERYFDNNREKMLSFLNDNGKRKLILDAGCGSGYSALLLFGDELKKHDYLGVDISDAVREGKERFQELGIEADFIKASLMDMHFIPDESIDIIFSEGVLHHTDSTERAIEYLSHKIKKGGFMMFYVYLKKSVIREFTDDYIREQLLSYGNEEAWEKLIPLTKLGKTLGELNIEIDVEEDIDLLGIKKGKLDLQRFFYWNICKAFYKPEYSIDEMNHLNFDWFRPLNCHRQTPEQVSEWCEKSGLQIVHKNIQEAGITVIAQKIKSSI
ncbi:MAG: class I SAM-dependent methyltransferase [Bacteroidota bacterium]